MEVNMQVLQRELEAVFANIEQVIVGKREVIELALCGVIAGGHVLIEDVPGVGKTNLVSAIAKSFDISFGRIQFTPDVLPSDITGFSIYNQKENAFSYHKGAIFKHLILADEINRASPKTQSSLLEVMEEYQVTVDNQTHFVPQPFIVFATQNPIEYAGTYPLPEAQMDRFLIRISLGYPSLDHEKEMLNRYMGISPLKDLTPVATVNTLIELKKIAQHVHVTEEIKNYIVNLVAKTRDYPGVTLGASPRATIALLSMSRAWALYSGRGFVTHDDVLQVANPVLAHRIILNREAQVQGLTEAEVIETIARSLL